MIMDTSDARIPLMAQSAQMPDLADMYGKASSMLGLMQQNQLNQLNFKGTQALNQALQDPKNLDPTTGQPDNSKVLASVASQGVGAAPAVIQYATNKAALANTQAQTGLAGAQTSQVNTQAQLGMLDAHSKLMGIEGQLLSGIHDQKSYDSVISMARNVDPNGFSDAPPQYDPDYVQGRVKQAVAVGDQIKNQIAMMNAGAAQTGAQAQLIGAQTQRGAAGMEAVQPVSVPGVGLVQPDRTNALNQGIQSAGGAPLGSQAATLGNPMPAAQQSNGIQVSNGGNTMIVPPGQDAAVQQQLGAHGIQVINAPGNPPNGAASSQPNSGNVPVIVPVNPTTLAEKTAQGGQLAATLSAYQNEAPQLGETLNGLKLLKQMAPNANLGTGAGAQGELQKLVATYMPGADPSKVTANALLDQIGSKVILNQRNASDTKVAGAFTQAQQHLEASAGAGSRNDPLAAFNAKIDTMQAAVERRLDIAQGATDYAQKNGGVIDNNYMNMAGQYGAQPLYGQQLKGGKQPSAQAIQYLKDNPTLQTKLQFMQHYGVSPSGYQQ